MAKYWQDSLNFIDFNELRKALPKSTMHLDVIAGKSALSRSEQEEPVDDDGLDVNVIISLWPVDHFGERSTKGPRHLLLAVPAMLVKESFFAPRLDAAPVFNTRYLGPAVGSGAFEIAESGDTESALTAALLDLTKDPASIPGWREWWTSCVDVIKSEVEATDIAGLQDVLAARATESLPDDRKKDVTWGLFAAVYPADGAGTKGISELYGSIIESGPSQVPELALFRTLCGGKRAKPVSTLPDVDECSLVGHIDEFGGDKGRTLFPLDDTQRTAVRAILSLDHGEMQAVNGPPGSGKTSMLRAVVASLWVQAAVFDKPCPIIVACGATNQSVTNVIEAFGKAPHPDSSVPIARRWIPDADSYGGYFPAAHILDGKEGATVRAKNVVIQPKAGARGFPFQYDGRPDALDPARALEYEQVYLARAREALPDDKFETVEEVVAILHDYLSTFYEDQGDLLRGDCDPDEIEPLCYQTALNWQEVWSKKRFDLAIEYADRLYTDPGDRETAQSFLDITCRSIAFHFAARYWEGKFLLAQRVRILNRHPNNVEEALRRMCMLTPCLVSTLHTVPRLASLDTTLLPPGDLRTHAFGLFDLLVIDEAGQAVPELAGAAFSLAKRAAVVGDLKQLAPIWNISTLGEMAIASRVGAKDVLEHIVRSRRSAATGSALGMARLVSKWNDPSDDGVTLRYHYRCKPSIIAYCNTLSYDNTLIARTLEDDGFFLPALAWVEVNSLPRPTAGSFRNEAEADEIIEWIVEAWPRWCCSEEFRGKPINDVVAILTAYRPQAEYLTNRLEAAFAAARKKKPGQWPSADEIQKVTIGTVHRLQGAERPIVCFSLVEGPDQISGSFIDRDETLMNVAVSRAKQSFIAFGHPRRLFSTGDVVHGTRLSPTRLLGAHFRSREEARLLYPVRLVLIEASGKLAALSAILGRTSRVIATGGALHTTDLSKDPDIPAGFAPSLCLEPHAMKALDDIRAVLPSVDEVVFATDDDRMGEYIAWQARYLLGSALDGKTLGRARLGAITDRAVFAAIGDLSGFHEPAILAEAVRETVDHIITKRFRSAIRAAKIRSSAVTEIALLRPIGAVTQDDLKAPRPVGRVQAAILGLLLRQAREVAANIDQRRIEALIEVDGREFVGTVFHAAEDRHSTDASKSEAVVKALDGVFLKLACRPLIVRERATSPTAGTAAVLATAWARHHLLPWTTMASLQCLYDGSWTKDPARGFDPEDPIEPRSASGHPPITPLDRAAPPQQLKSSMRSEDHSVYSVLWDFHLATELGELTSVYAKFDFELIGKPVGPLHVRFEGMSIQGLPGELRYVAAADASDISLPEADELLDAWQEMDGIAPIFRVVPAARWDVRVDHLLMDMEREKIGRPSTYTRALERMTKAGLIAFPTGDGPIQLTPDGIATALTLESAEPVLSAPEFSTRLSDITGRIVAGELGPRDAFVELLMVLAPNEDPDIVGPRIWNSLPELEAALTQPSRPLPAALVGPIDDDDLPRLADVGN